MDAFTLGILGTLASSFFWAGAVILFRKSSDYVTAFGVNVGKNLVGLLCFSVTLVVMGIPMFPALPATDFLMLVLSGVVGIGLGDLLFMSSLKMLGAGLNAIVGCIYTPLMIVAGVLIFHESISVQLIIGAVLVVSAIIIASSGDMHNRPRHLFLGIFVATASMLSTLVGAVLYKDLLSRYDLFYLTWVRLIAGNAFLIVYYLFHPRRANLLQGLQKLHNWTMLGLSGFLGTYLAISAWALGLRNLPASLVAVFSELTVIVIILMAYFFLREPLTPRKMAATALAVGGAFLSVMT
jgi:drug/metabolite transporter (DMT)-like permease